MAGVEHPTLDPYVGHGCRLSPGGGHTRRSGATARDQNIVESLMPTLTSIVSLMSSETVLRMLTFLCRPQESGASRVGDDLASSARITWDKSRASGFGKSSNQGDCGEDVLKMRCFV